ncbi:MAG TPA: ATP-dependent helicase [Kiritimatiellia bacterium]|nr:ATP-dependent helicase [Kiritimatiellia bacterium]
MSVAFEQELNEEQLAAVQAPDGPVLVIAAAGTGKTRTLTYRVAWLVERGIEPDRILLLTFTNRAAREMLDRARLLVGDGVGGLWGGTFHHMANRMLRRHGDALGYGSDYTILDQDDARSLLKSAADELNLLGKHFPKPDVLLSIYGLANSKEVPVIRIAEQRLGAHEIDLHDVVRVHELYEKKKTELNAMDFDDLLVNGLRLFREHPDILARYRERFMHILVDEYQDTNVIQAAWVDILATERRNLLVVGDDFQSIYSWRGADFRNILSFPQRYPGTTVFKLETNYRSVPGILDVANSCIAGNPEQFQKTLRATRPATRPPVVARLRDGDQQALYVVDRIRRLRAAGRSLNDIVVLYRAHYHALELQLLLARERLPFLITSGMRFFEQAHIKDACTLLRLVANPGDELSFSRLMQLFPKMGKKTCVKVWTALGGRFDVRDPAAREKLLSLLPTAARAPWQDLEEVFGILDGDPATVIERFVAAFYDQYAVETFDNYDRRKEDLEELVLFTSRFTSTTEFLSEMALLTNLDTEVDDPHATHNEAVRLSTIHQAKGLEWPSVFVLWLSDGMFPSSRSMNDDEGDSEERRLFYVATTRAKDELYLCVPALRRARDGGVQFYPPSRFVTDLPPPLVKEENFYG